MILTVIMYVDCKCLMMRHAILMMFCLLFFNDRLRKLTISCLCKQGGAVYIGSSTKGTFENCNFTSNIAYVSFEEKPSDYSETLKSMLFRMISCMVVSAHFFAFTFCSSSLPCGFEHTQEVSQSRSHHHTYSRCHHFLSIKSINLLST